MLGTVNRLVLSAIGPRKPIRQPVDTGMVERLVGGLSTGAIVHANRWYRPPHRLKDVVVDFVVAALVFTFFLVLRVFSAGRYRLQSGTPVGTFLNRKRSSSTDRTCDPLRIPVYGLKQVRTGIPSWRLCGPSDWSFSLGFLARVGPCHCMLVPRSRGPCPQGRVKSGGTHWYGGSLQVHPRLHSSLTLEFDFSATWFKKKPQKRRSKNAFQSVFWLEFD